MSIATKTGDRGVTDLMYHRQVSKTHPRVEACGAVDELNASLGWVRAVSTQPLIRESLAQFQRDLVVMMGELATDPRDQSRFLAGGFQQVAPTSTAKLDELVQQLEGQIGPFKGWAMPGATSEGAALDVARTVCRRAERRVVALLDQAQLSNPEILVFLNRLGDLLWLMARWVERPGAA